MTPETFLKEFGALAETPGGVGKLRGLVLDLAVRGKLVAPEPSEDSVPHLADSSVEAELVPYEVPGGWAWVKMGTLGRFIGGGTPSKSNLSFWKGSIPWVSPKDMKVQYIADAQDHISRAAVGSSATKLIPEGALLMVLRGMILAHSFPVALTTAEVTVNQDMKALVLDDPELGEYLLRACQASRSRMLANVQRSSHGTCRLETAAVENFPIPVPPLPEQKRIVAKVDQLMALCDELEARQTKKRKVSVRATKASLMALTEAQEPKVLRASWKSVSGYFDTLFDNVENVGELRHAIFGLACAGHLTSQRSTVRALLPEVESRREAWIDGESGNGEALRLRKKLSAHNPTLPASVLPSGWIWASLLKACWRVVDCHNKTAPYVGRGVPLVRTSNVRDGEIDMTTAKYVSEETYAYWSRRCPPEPGDILFTREAPMGECGIVQPGVRLCMGQRMMLLRTFSDLILPKYLICALRDPLFQERMMKAGVGSTVKHLRVGDVEGLVIPIPPTDEQHRIVAKVDQLMALCDDLEAKLKLSDERGEKLMKAVVEAMVA